MSRAIYIYTSFFFFGFSKVFFKFVLFSSVKGPTLQGKKKLSKWDKSCLLEKTAFRKGVVRKTSNMKLQQKLSPLYKMVQNLSRVWRPLNRRLSCASKKPSHCPLGKESVYTKELFISIIKYEFNRCCQLSSLFASYGR